MTKDEIKERDTLFCELLFETGSVIEASNQLDITIRQGRKIQERNKDLILEMTNSELAALAYKAVKGIRNALEEDGTVPKAEVRLKAAEGVLDRIGASKKMTGELEVKVETPIILMPAKDIAIIPTIKVSTEDDKE